MRRPQRNEPNCPDPETIRRFEEPAPSRPVPKCDPPAADPEKTFAEPVPPEVDAPYQPFPDPVSVSNEAVTVSCGDWPAFTGEGPAPTGDDVTVEAGTFSEELYFQSFELSSEELRYIASVTAGNTTAAGYLDEGDTSALAVFFNISNSKALLIVETYEALKEAVGERARAVALARLDCRWYNTNQPAWCPENAVIADGRNPIIAPAGSFWSQSSQADAQAQALAFATAGLKCAWGNEQVTVRCGDLNPDFADLDPGQPDLAGGAMLGEEHPGDNTTVYPGDPDRFRVNIVTVAAGTFTVEGDNPADAKSSANQQAIEYALSQLDCFYVNPQVVVECDTESGMTPPVEIPIDFDGVSQGNPVTVPFHTVASEVSWSDAEQQARALGTSSLNCLWRNIALVYSCDDAQSDPSDPAQVLAHAEGGEYDDTLLIANKDGIPVFVATINQTLNQYAVPNKSDAYTVIVQEGEFTSSVSQEDANQIAAIYALSQLGCVYCNPRILPACADPEARNFTRVVNGVDYVAGSDSVETPIYGDVPYNPDDPERLASDMGDSATFCGADPYQVTADADMAAAIPVADLINVTTVCEYCNDPIYAACHPESIVGFGGVGFVLDETVLVDIYGNPILDENGLPVVVGPEDLDPAPLPAGTWDFYNYGNHTVETRPSLRYFMDPVTHRLIEAGSWPAGVGRYSDRSSQGFISMPRGNVCAASKELANQMAAEMLSGMLNCFWDSARIEALCGADGSLPAEQAEYGPHMTIHVGGGIEDFDLLDPRSKGEAGDPVIVEARAYQSYESQRAANVIPLLVATSQLDCFWSNDEVTEYCDNWPPGNVATAVYYYTVEAGLFTSREGKAEANLIASLMAEAQLVCLYCNEEVTAADMCPFPCTLSKRGHVPACTLTSNVSVADATNLAGALAMAMSVCLDLSTLVPCEDPPPDDDGSASTSESLESGERCCDLAEVDLSYPANHPLIYGRDNCFDCELESHWGTIALDVAVTTSGNPPIECKNWGARVSIDKGTPLVGGVAWAGGGAQAYSFPLGLNGEGSARAIFRLDGIEPCETLKVRVTVWTRESAGVGDNPEEECTHEWDVVLPECCGGGCGDSSSSEESTSSSPVSSGSAGSSSATSSSGSSKVDSAIIPSYSSPTGFRKMYVIESNRVLFTFAYEDVNMAGRVCSFEIPPEHVDACEPGTLKLYAPPVPGSPAILWGTVVNNRVYVRCLSEGRIPATFNVMVTGIRKGFREVNMEYATYPEFLANEEWISRRKPR